MTSGASVAWRRCVAIYEGVGDALAETLLLSRIPPLAVVAATWAVADASDGLDPTAPYYHMDLELTTEDLSTLHALSQRIFAFLVRDSVLDRLRQEFETADA